MVNYNKTNKNIYLRGKEFINVYLRFLEFMFYNLRIYTLES